MSSTETDETTATETETETETATETETSATEDKTTDNEGNDETKDSVEAKSEESQVEPDPLDLNSIKAGLTTLRSSSNNSFYYSTLSLPGRSLKSLSGNDLQKYQLLEHINVNNNQLTELSALNTLENLSSVNAQYNHIKSLTNLNFKNVELLQLDNNLITVLNCNETECMSLKTLTLSSNQISSIDSNTLNGLANLTYLDVSNNKLAKLPTSSKPLLSNLKVLILSSNQLTSCDGITSISTAIEKLHLNSNALPNLAELKKLQPLTRLTDLSIEGNTAISEEIPEESDLLKQLLLILPQLNVFNSKPITYDDRVQADLLRKEKEAEERAKREQEEREKAEADAANADNDNEEDDEDA
jgi:Leucine-rich repeat (LRR) protein